MVDRKIKIEFKCPRCGYKESTFHPDRPPECIFCYTTMWREEEVGRNKDIGKRAKSVKGKKKPYNNKIRRAIREAKGSQS